MKRTTTGIGIAVLTALLATGCGALDVDTENPAPQTSAPGVSAEPTTEATTGAAATASTAPAATPTPTTDASAGEPLDPGTFEEATRALENIDTVEDVPSTDPDSSTYDPEVPDYDREAQFGEAWSDDHSAPGRHNGCDTRQDLLVREIDNPVMRSDGSCVVDSGEYVEPYFGTKETFTRGEPTMDQDEIDHVLPLSLAWYLGAWEWDQDKRVSFANDLDRNLLVTTRAANSGGNDVDGDGYKDRKDLGEYPGKSDLAGYQWIEWISDPNRACAFAAKYTLAADYYDLPILEQDKAAFEDAFAQC